jgi:hypothetical protein
MKELVSKLLSDKIEEARNILDLKIKDLIEEKINQFKIQIATSMFGDTGVEMYFEETNSTVQRSNVQKMGRTKIIKFRVRKGKIQRRRKFSTVKGYTVRGGKMTRMMPAERRHRHIASIKSKFKRKAKLVITLRKRRISLRKRKSVGL